ncbi:hypothetical protein FGO68_gene1984 [Halteria grandinella]|uniref:Uncharacterized protein n=1 Tax=Halteria grandinella TaxID=5974 RepID=A0A8J8P2B5_HALGN|nr:hypothetical protein FGO68_gene1984 [Halteria grandinella]
MAGRNRRKLQIMLGKRNMSGKDKDCDMLKQFNITSHSDDEEAADMEMHQDISDREQQQGAPNKRVKILEEMTQEELAMRKHNIDNQIEYFIQQILPPQQNEEEYQGEHKEEDQLGDEQVQGQDSQLYDEAFLRFQPRQVPMRVGTSKGDKEFYNIIHLMETQSVCAFTNEVPLINNHSVKVYVYSVLLTSKENQGCSLMDLKLILQKPKLKRALLLSYGTTVLVEHSNNFLLYSLQDIEDSISLDPLKIQSSKNGLLNEMTTSQESQAALTIVKKMCINMDQIEDHNLQYSLALVRGLIHQNLSRMGYFKLTSDPNDFKYYHITYLKDVELKGTHPLQNQEIGAIDWKEFTYMKLEGFKFEVVPRLTPTKMYKFFNNWTPITNQNYLYCRRPLFKWITQFENYLVNPTSQNQKNLWSQHYNNANERRMHQNLIKYKQNSTERCQFILKQIQSLFMSEDRSAKLMFVESMPPTIISGFTDINFGLNPFTMTIDYARNPLYDSLGYEESKVKSVKLCDYYTKKFNADLDQADNEPLVTINMESILNFSTVIELPEQQTLGPSLDPNQQNGVEIILPSTICQIIMPIDPEVERIEETKMSADDECKEMYSFFDKVGDSEREANSLRNFGLQIGSPEDSKIAIKRIIVPQIQEQREFFQNVQTRLSTLRWALVYTEVNYDLANQLHRMLVGRKDYAFNHLVSEPQWVQVPDEETFKNAIISDCNPNELDLIVLLMDDPESENANDLYCFLSKKQVEFEYLAVRKSDLEMGLMAGNYKVTQRNTLGRLKETLRLECCGITPGFVVETTIVLVINIRRELQKDKVEIEWIQHRFHKYGSYISISDRYYKEPEAIESYVGFLVGNHICNYMKNVDNNGPLTNLVLLFNEASFVTQELSTYYKDKLLLRILSEVPFAGNLTRLPFNFYLGATYLSTFDTRVLYTFKDDTFQYLDVPENELALIDQPGPAVGSCIVKIMADKAHGRFTLYYIATLMEENEGRWSETVNMPLIAHFAKNLAPANIRV